MLEIVERWREPAGRYFRVRADDGRRYVLCCREPAMDWWLEAGPPPR